MNRNGYSILSENIIYVIYFLSEMNFRCILLFWLDNHPECYLVIENPF